MPASARSSAQQCQPGQRQRAKRRGLVSAPYAETNLERERGRVRANQLSAVELRRVLDSADLRLQGAELRLQELAIVFGQTSVGRLHADFTHTTQNVVHFSECTFGRLRHRDTVRSVAFGNVVRADLRLHALADREACGVVRSGVDAKAARQAVEALWSFSWLPNRFFCACIEDVLVCMNSATCVTLLPWNPVNARASLPSISEERSRRIQLEREQST